MSDTQTNEFQLVAELRSADISAAAWLLTDRFGFKSEAGYLDLRKLPSDVGYLRLRRMDQVIEIVPADKGKTLGHGTFDHLALACRDVDAALIALRAKWTELDPEVTPDGPMNLPMFWTHGVRVAFVLGPQDARLELCQHNSNANYNKSLPVNIIGHDHFGVRCRNVDEATVFYRQFGFLPEAEVTIPTPDGEIDIRFVKRGSYLLEIASTPQNRASEPPFAEHPIWAKIVLETTDMSEAAGIHIGPNGEVVEVRHVTSLSSFHFNSEDLV